MWLPEAWLLAWLPAWLLLLRVLPGAFEEFVELSLDGFVELARLMAEPAPEAVSGWMPGPARISEVCDW